MPFPWPLGLRERIEEIQKRYDHIAAQLNEYGYDPFGLDPRFGKQIATLLAILYDYYFRVETQGIEQVPTGRVLLIGNHAGNTIPFDGALLAAAMLIEGDPPRLCRGMAEFYLPNIPWWNELIHRAGAVVGTPENCVQLLEREEAIIVMPEGHRGFIKPYSKAYKLQRFGTGFVRLALQTRTPIVPVGIVGSEEQSPGLYDAKGIGRLIGAPAFPITVTFPLLGVLGYLPFPVKYRYHFGEPILFEGEGNEPDESIQERVAIVRDRISLLIEAGLEERSSWFS
jgi:1-acyl-sn-glycerol-3-phosphate acyltransferase